MDHSRSSHKVRELIVRRLPDGEPLRKDIAKELCVSDHTLQRRLRKEGTSFQELVDNTRKDLARQYLRQPNLTLGQAEYLLGFGEQSAFFRACKRWFDMTPGQYRQQQGKLSQNAAKALPGSHFSTLPAHAEDSRELLFQNDRYRIVRCFAVAPQMSVICKEALGEENIDRIRHERNILDNLGDLNGIAKLVPDLCTSTLLVFENHHGSPLPSRLKEGPFPTDLAVDWAVQVAGILANVHHKGMIRKDFNPHHIHLSAPEMRPLIIDFDLATVSTEERPGFLHHKQIADTLAYMAPEQTWRMSRPIDHRVDLYAFGVTLYQVVIGRLPFKQPTRFV